MRPLARLGRKLAVGVVGTLVIAVGVVMIVLPGPATLIIPAGLGILATEFSWARRLRARLVAALVALGQRVGSALASTRRPVGRTREADPERARP